jgi:hypothetical protein
MIKGIVIAAAMDPEALAVAREWVQLYVYLTAKEMIRLP